MSKHMSLESIHGILNENTSAYKCAIEITKAYAANNPLNDQDVFPLVQKLYQTLSGLGSRPKDIADTTPEIPVKKSENFRIKVKTKSSKLMEDPLLAQIPEVANTPKNTDHNEPLASSEELIGNDENAIATFSQNIEDNGSQSENENNNNVVETEINDINHPMQNEDEVHHKVEEISEESLTDYKDIISESQEGGDINIVPDEVTNNHFNNALNEQSEVQNEDSGSDDELLKNAVDIKDNDEIAADETENTGSSLSEIIDDENNNDETIAINAEEDQNDESKVIDNPENAYVSNADVSFKEASESLIPEDKNEEEDPVPTEKNEFEVIREEDVGNFDEFFDINQDPDGNEHI